MVGFNVRRLRRHQVVLWSAVVLVVALIVAVAVWYISWRSAGNVSPGPTPAQGSTPIATTAQSSSTTGEPVSSASASGLACLRDWPSLDASMIWLTYAPAAATVKLDGVVIEPDDNISCGINVTPGTHTVAIAMAGFDDFSRTVTLEAGDYEAVFTALESNSPTTADYYDTHYDGGVIEWITDRWVDLDDAVADGDLPYQGDGFRIDLGTGSDASDYNYLQVTCDLQVLTRLECKAAATDAVSSQVGLEANFYKLIFLDA